MSKVKGFVLDDEFKPGYHLSPIPRGEYGELSKVKEELEEVLDADQQGVKLMILQELSDLLGSVEGYLEKHHPGVTMDDLKGMSDVTKRAFRSGSRA